MIPDTFPTIQLLTLLLLSTWMLWFLLLPFWFLARILLVPLKGLINAIESFVSYK